MFIEDDDLLHRRSTCSVWIHSVHQPSLVPIGANRAKARNT
jgi:hypothetical protein